MKSWMIDSVIETDDQKKRHEKRVINRKKKLVEQQIAIAIVQHNKDLAVYYAEKYDVSPQEFAKMVIKYSSGNPIDE